LFHERPHDGYVAVGLLVSNRNPQGRPRGETESRFGWVCRVKVVGLAVPGSQPVTLGLLGFGGASIRPSPLGLEEDPDALKCESLPDSFFEVREIASCARKSVQRPKHL
jgi:hypothetical protein